MNKLLTSEELADRVLPIPYNDVGREYLSNVFRNRDKQIAGTVKSEERAFVLASIDSAICDLSGCADIGIAEELYGLKEYLVSCWNEKDQ